MDPEKESEKSTTSEHGDGPPRKEDVEKPSPSQDREPEQMENEEADADETQHSSLEEYVSLPREIVVIGLVVLGQLTTQIGFGQVLSIIHIIGHDFNIQDPGILSWLMAGYSLSVGTFILFTGRLGDLFGWKRMLVIGYVWFAVWSLIAGLAWYSNYILFIFARVLQGIGPAIILPNSLALLGGLYTQGKRKNMAFAIFGACAPGGSILGSAMGGVFALAWWPWTFFSFAIALVFIAVVAAILIPDPQEAKPGLEIKTLRGALTELDILGAVTGVGALVLFNFAWNQAPISGWGSATAIVTLILGVGFIGVFFYIELKFSSKPLLPWDVFSMDNAFILGCVACGWANFGIWIYYVWQILLVLRGSSPLLATAYLSPVVMSGACAAILTGILLGKVRPAWAMVIALCCFFTGTTLIATFPVHQLYWEQFFVCTLIAPFGMDISFPSATLVVSNSVKKEHQGVAASLVTTIVNYSISIGLGLAGTIEVHVNNGGLTYADTLHGYRSSLYMAMGLVGLGIGLAITYVSKTYYEERRTQQKEQKQDGQATTA